MVCLFCASSKPRSHQPSISSLIVRVRRWDLDRFHNPPPTGSSTGSGGIGIDGEAKGPGEFGIGGIVATGTGLSLSPKPCIPSYTTTTDLIFTFAVA
ncbi:hypothetical protein ACHAQH_005139 [Verticillium albo-atrum]